MANIEAHVTSLSLSRKLKELGLNQQSLFYWVTNGCLPNGEDFYLLKHYPSGIESKDYDEDSFYSSFLASELGEMLPVYIQKHPLYELSMFCEDEEWGVDEDDEPTVLREPKRYYVDYKAHYVHDGCEYIETSVTKWDASEANARAKMLIHLIENGLVDAEWRERWLS